MKKFISLVLCLVIAMSVSMTAFAAAGTIVPGTAQTVTVNRGKSAEYSFTAPETAVYQVTVKALTKTYADFYLEFNNDDYGNGLYLDVSYNNDNDISVFSDYFAAYKGYKYNFSLFNNVDSLSRKDQKELGVPDTAKFELSVKKAALPEVKLGGTYTSKNTVTGMFMDYCYFCMMPKTSGYYNFRSQPKDVVIPQIEIISDECVSDFGGSLNSDVTEAIEQVTGSNVYLDFTSYMEKGHYYIIGISGLAIDVKNGKPDWNEEHVFETSVTFTVNDGSNIQAKSIKFDEEKISMAKGDFDYNTCTIYPAGVTPFDINEVTVTSSNPRVADVSDYFLDHNYMNLDIESYHYGKTTITVTLPNGVSADFKVAVKPRIILFFENLLSYFFG